MSKSAKRIKDTEIKKQYKKQSKEFRKLRNNKRNTWIFK